MADEVVIEEYTGFNINLQIPTVPVTTQVLDIATASAQLNAATEYVRIVAKDTGFWYKFGGSDVSAAADTDGNLWLAADQFRDHKIDPNSSNRYIDTAADA